MFCAVLCEDRDASNGAENCGVAFEDNDLFTRLGDWKLRLALLFPMDIAGGAGLLRLLIILGDIGRDP